MPNILVDEISCESKAFERLVKACLRFETDLSKKWSDEDILADIQRFISNEDHWITLQLNDGAGGGAILQVEFCPWDSDVLGLKTGRIRYLLSTAPAMYSEACTRAQNLLRSQGIEYLLVRSSSVNWAKIHKLEANGFELVDGIINFSSTTHEIASSISPGPDYENIVPITTADVEELGAFCSGTFQVSRFHNDPYLSLEQAQDAYREWGKNIARGKAADIAFKLPDETKILAFISGKIRQGIKSKTAAIDLIAVGPQAAGRGVGQSLILRVANWAIENGCEKFEVQTQVNNLVACRLYQRSGFSITDSMLTFRWVPGHARS